MSLVKDTGQTFKEMFQKVFYNISMIQLFGNEIVENNKLLLTIKDIEPYTGKVWNPEWGKIDHKSKIYTYQGRKIQVWFAHSGNPYCAIEIDGD